MKNLSLILVFHHTYDVQKTRQDLFNKIGAWDKIALNQYFIYRCQPLKVCKFNVVIILNWGTITDNTSDSTIEILACFQRVLDSHRTQESETTLPFRCRQKKKREGSVF